MGGVGMGFFTPSDIFWDLQQFCRRVRSEIPFSIRGFPLAEMRMREDAYTSVSLISISGPLPIVVGNPEPGPEPSAAFWFVVDATNRPCLFTAPADQATAKAILTPEMRSKFSMGALELVPGRAIHFDASTTFIGLLGLTDGSADFLPPEALIVRVPCKEAHEIGSAIATMKRMLRKDERFKDMVR